MRTRSQTSQVRRRQTTSPPLSDISEVSHVNETLRQDCEAIHGNDQERHKESEEALTEYTPPSESDAQQTTSTAGATGQAVYDLQLDQDGPATLPQLSLTPPPARQTVFLPSPEPDQAPILPADPQAAAEVERRFEEEKRIGEAHFAALGLMLGESQAMEVDSIADGEQADLASTNAEAGPSHQYRTRQQYRRTTETEAELQAARILVKMSMTWRQPVPKPRKTRGPNKKKTTVRDVAPKYKQQVQSKPKAPTVKKVVSRRIVSSSSSESQADHQGHVDSRLTQVRFADENDIWHFDVDSPAKVLNISSCIDTPSSSQQSVFSPMKAMIARPPSPMRARMDLVYAHGPGGPSSVSANSCQVMAPIFRPNFEFPTDTEPGPNQIMRPPYRSPSEHIVRLGNWLIESITDRPAYITSLYRHLIAKRDLDTARKLLELVHSVQRQNVTDMPPMPRPLSFSRLNGGIRRLEAGPNVPPPRRLVATGEAGWQPISVSMEDTVGSNGNLEPEEDLRRLRREVSPDTP